MTARAEPEGSSALAATGQAVANSEHDLWIQSTALQTALLQAYLAARLAELTVALGLTFVAIGGGLAAAGRHAG